MNFDEKFWREFEAKDRAKNPDAWRVHDHFMAHMKTRQARARRTYSLTEITLFILVLVLLATLIPT